MPRRGAEGPSGRGRARAVISLRLIASLAAAGLVALTTIVVTRVNEQSLRRTLENEATTHLVLEARNIAMASVDPLLSDYPELTLVPLASDLLKVRPELREVAILNHRGEIQGAPDPRLIGTAFVADAETHPFTAQVALRAQESLSRSDAVIEVTVPVLHNGAQDLGRVVLGLDPGFIEAKVVANRNHLLSIAAVLLAVAVVASGLLMSLLFRPLSTLRAGLERIGHGDLDTPMPTGDMTELGLLAGTVNTMAAQLKSSRALAIAREQEVIDTQREVIDTLGQVVEGRSSETANHTVRVGAMSYELALLAGLPRAEAELLRAAAPMHDLGKVGIPDAILNKPGKYTEDEYAVMKRHADMGYRILAKSQRPILKAAAIIAHEHHERWDGTGYPRRLSGEDIHIYGRIVALVDFLDAVTSDRIYRKAMPLDKVLGIIREERGRHFEPELVDLLLGNLDRFLAISEALKDGEHDIVVAAELIRPMPVPVDPDLVAAS